jgi:uncharacterized Ntn-hydrolase superfamily protein
MTFSIAARCPRTAMLGVAVSTAVPAVGALCPYVRSGVGAVSTQAWVNPYLALRTLDGMQAGLSAQRALEAALQADEAKEVRQVGLVDAQGRAACWTGSDCTPWSGDRVGEGLAIQGNMLSGPEVVAAMEEAFRAAEAEELAERLLRALEAGQGAGGDKRGRQSAALLVHNEQDYAYVNLRVDEHPSPVPELRRVFEVFKLQARPFLDGMPRRGALARPAPPDVTKMLLRPPRERPGGTGADLWTAFTGLDLPEARRDELLRAFAPIAAEIARLREVDLGDVHPAVVFDPRVDPS